MFSALDVDCAIDEFKIDESIDTDSVQSERYQNATLKLLVYYQSFCILFIHNYLPSKFVKTTIVLYNKIMTVIGLLSLLVLLS